MHIAIIERVERGMEASVSSSRDILLCIVIFVMFKCDARYKNIYLPLPALPSTSPSVRSIDDDISLVYCGEPLQLVASLGAFWLELRLDVSREVWRDTRRHRCSRDKIARRLARRIGPFNGHKCGRIRPKKGPSSTLRGHQVAE